MASSGLKQIAAIATAIPWVLVNRGLLRLGLRQRPDGWRRGTGLLLRGPAATFVLSVFGVNFWSDEGTPARVDVESSKKHLAQRLLKFLTREPASHICVRRSNAVDRAIQSSGPSYTLAFENWRDGTERFIPPTVWAGEAFPAEREASVDALFHIICRLNPSGGADLWFRVNHIGIDGVPTQDILSRLESEWGSAEEVIFPAPEDFSPYAVVRDSPGREGLKEIQAFFDFAPLVAWRKRVNQKLAEPMTLSAAFLWCLARVPEFAALRLGTTVELPSMGKLGRGVGVIVVRPADYSARKNGLADYVHYFNRELALTKRRESDGCKTLDAAALVPAGLAKPLLLKALNGERSFGTMALSVIRDGKVFGAPMGDAGHPDGFIALGSVGLPSRNGKRVGCVTIKGPGKIAGYPKMIQRALDELAEEV
ncbi:MAG TPA: hypothetical protein VGN88_08830 [Phycisphaerae bacterium]|jgi:hypothetical protein